LELSSCRSCAAAAAALSKLKKSRSKIFEFLKKKRNLHRADHGKEERMRTMGTMVLMLFACVAVGFAMEEAAVLPMHPVELGDAGGLHLMRFTIL